MNDQQIPSKPMLKILFLVSGRYWTLPHAWKLCCFRLANWFYWMSKSHSQVLILVNTEKMPGHEDLAFRRVCKCKLTRGGYRGQKVPRGELLIVVMQQNALWCVKHHNCSVYQFAQQKIIQWATAVSRCRAIEPKWKPKKRSLHQISLKNEGRVTKIKGRCICQLAEGQHTFFFFEIWIASMPAFRKKSRHTGGTFGLSRKACK